MDVVAPMSETGMGRDDDDDDDDVVGSSLMFSVPVDSICELSSLVEAAKMECLVAIDGEVVSLKGEAGVLTARSGDAMGRPTLSKAQVRQEWSRTRNQQRRSR